MLQHCCCHVCNNVTVHSELLDQIRIEESDFWSTKMIAMLLCNAANKAASTLEVAGCPLAPSKEHRIIMLATFETSSNFCLSSSSSQFKSSSPNTALARNSAYLNSKWAVQHVD